MWILLVSHSSEYLPQKVNIRQQCRQYRVIQAQRAAIIFVDKENSKCEISEFAVPTAT